MRRRLKDGIHGTLVNLGIASVARRWHSNYGLILVYHNIVPEGEDAAGEMALHLEQETFARQLDLLSETHDLLELDALLNAGRSNRPSAAITFDDGYRGALSAGLEELTSRDIPATYFVSPGLLNQTAFWWDAIAAAHSGRLPDDIRNTALSQCRGQQEQILRWAKAKGISRGNVPGQCRSATPSELRRASEEPGITIGSHTWSHPNLSKINPEAITRELRTCWDWLDDEIESDVPWLAYPYGIIPEESSSSLRDEERAVTTEAEFIDLGGAAHDLLRLPRINVPSGISLARFELLISGL